MSVSIAVLIPTDLAGNTKWVELSTYTEQGITINDTVDDNLDSASITLVTPETVDGVDFTKALLPDTVVVYRETNEGVVGCEYYFQISDAGYSPIRTLQATSGEVNGVGYLYQHVLPLIELTKDLENKTLPDFAVTQPKTVYSEYYRRDVAFSLGYNLVNKKLMSGQLERPSIDESSTLTRIERNNNNAGTIGRSGSVINLQTIYDSVTDEAVGGVAVEDYEVSVSFNMGATAPQIVVDTGFLAFNDIRMIYPSVRDTPLEVSTRSFIPLVLSAKVRYFDVSDNLMLERNLSSNIFFYGNLTTRQEVGSVLDNIQINGYANTAQGIINVPRLAGCHRATLEFDIVNDTTTVMFGDLRGSGYGKKSNKTYTGSDILEEIAFAYNSFETNSIDIFYRMNSGSISIISSVINTDTVDPYQTGYDLVTKALNEVNLREKNKYVLSSSFASLLKTYVMPEATLQSYTLKDLLSKVGRGLNVTVVLGDTDLLGEGDNPLRTISYIKPGGQEYQVSVNDLVYTQKYSGRVMSDKYSTVMSRISNLVPENEFITETIGIGVDSPDRAQVTDTNAAFITSQPIYWVRSAVLNSYTNSLGAGPTLTATYRNSLGSVVSLTIKGNNPHIAPDSDLQTWDISARLLEADVYNSLPDVNATTDEGRNYGYMSKTNTLYYTSGSKGVYGLGHMGPSIPTYLPPFTTSIEVQNYAMIEMLALLAYQAWSGAYNEFNIPQSLATTFTDAQFRNTVLTLSYTPLVEFTYRSTTSQNSKNRGVKDKLVNVQDRVVSMHDTDDMLVKEHAQKGNEDISITLQHPDVTSCYKTGWRLSDGYVITARNMTIYGPMVECTYTLSDKYTTLSDNVALDIKFERFAVPYDFVWREILNYTHLIIADRVEDIGGTFVGGKLKTVYDSDLGAPASEYKSEMVLKALRLASLPRDTFGRAQLTYDKTGSLVPAITSLNVRLSRILNKFSVSFVGKWYDNYSAGSQLITYNDSLYSEPLRYTDASGKVESVVMDMFENALFSPYSYPNGHYPVTAFRDPLVIAEQVADFRSGDKKDAREGYEFNFTTSLVAGDGDRLIPFVPLGDITHLGIVTNFSGSLTEFTSYADIRFSEIAPVADVTYTRYDAAMRIDVTVNSADLRFSEYDGVNVALVSQEDNVNASLGLVVKLTTLHPDEYGNWRLRLYVVPTRYGRRAKGF